MFAVNRKEKLESLGVKWSAFLGCWLCGVCYKKNRETNVVVVAVLLLNR